MIWLNRRIKRLTLILKLFKYNIMKRIRKMLRSIAIVGLIVFNVLSSYSIQNTSKLTLKSMNLLTVAFAENNDCTSSTYGAGAYLKEHSCVITSTTYIFPIGWTTTLKDGYKKCCTQDEAAPPDSSCYGDVETTCRAA